MKKIYVVLLLQLIVGFTSAGTYQTIASGSYSDPSIWEDGVMPGQNITNGNVVYINHDVDFGDIKITNGGQFIVNGNASGLRIEMPGGEGKGSITIAAGGSLATVEPITPIANIIIADNSGVCSVESNDKIYYGSCDNITLPVNLLYFTATPQKTAVKLDWASSKAWDFSHYELERSADGVTFDYLTTIDAEENTNWVVNYSYSDRQPLSGISFYRLKAVDIDGQFEYKGVEVVQLAGEAAVNVYPNPSNRGFLHVQQQKAAGARVSLKDNSGRTVYTGTMERSGKSIDTSALQPGMYVLTVESTTGIQKKHVIIQ